MEDTLVILYGSRTGNAKSVAVLAYDYATHLGYDVRLIDMQEYEFETLKDADNLMITVSTHGEGEPPVQAEPFYEFLHGPDAPEKIRARYAVVGLGDSSYRYYCQTGKDIDKRLEEMGGKRLLDVESCDIDFEETAKNWVRQAIEAFKPHLPVKHEKGKDPFVFEIKTDHGAQAYRAELLEKKLLTQEGSSKKVLHVSLNIKDSGMDYEPGDAISVFGTNSRLYIDELLKELGFDKAYPIKSEENVRLLKDVLIHDYDLTLITPLMIKKYAELSENLALKKLVNDAEKLDAYAERHDILDLVTDYPADMKVEDFLSVLRKLNARLYSVASSRMRDQDIVDITVKVIENEGENRIRHGVVSSFLWNRLEVGDKVPVALEPIVKFRLPEDPKTPVVMICAGTGIAPFRGFLQERKIKQAKGKNWLIFGERNRKTDFLYEEEIIEYQKAGFLDKVSTAFSRDQKEKVYVSHILEQHADKLIEWMDQGAVLYICGSKSKMARSVRESMVNIVAETKKIDLEKAGEYLDSLKADKKIQEEVY